MKISTDGQVTIPAEIRERLGLLPDTEVELTVVDGGVMVRKIWEKDPDFSSFIDSIRGTLKGGMTTDEVMALTRGDD
ncbi:MAG TPA: AbrB/MazE/SpoVT family DNA-binding domain-containing protein [Longimicrobium sp.]|jgi:AbrB family looped-hinge helix DNA binding protein|nr:AbrB/MazE/SpoVT family DNA-binding domain-containing protein [Longimicrobium sp.]